jgi:hypothetical protein
LDVEEVKRAGGRHKINDLILNREVAGSIIFTIDRIE